jgi:hypothetical protein
VNKKVTVPVGISIYGVRSFLDIIFSMRRVPRKNLYAAPEVGRKFRLRPTILCPKEFGMNSTTLLCAVCLTAVAGGAAILIFVWQKMSAFLASTPVLRTEQDLSEFKDIARSGMWAALAMILLWPLPILVLFVALSATGYRVGGWMAIVPCSLIGFLFKSIETKIQSIPADGEHLSHERDRVVRTWLKKMLPDF